MHIGREETIILPDGYASLFKLSNRGCKIAATDIKESSITVRYIIMDYFTYNFKDTIILDNYKLKRLKLSEILDNVFTAKHDLFENLQKAMRYLFRLYQDKSRETRTEIVKKEIDNRLIIINRFIRENYKKNITLNDLSRLIDCNPTYLCNTYSKVFGVSPMYHINKLRIKESMEILKTTDLSIAVVSKEIGYNSSAQFCALFKRFIGQTPTQFRLNNVKSYGSKRIIN
ncbi:hypothetical protein VN24_00125 [Paenibacillus beijingensis]|uniref:HTH araC/xylS-type domain-containing protein n=1 Tax=Paenibacillus beijingensis TaxID=1126833 RepID=A0A0D5NEH6_9BACL|nr:hypothetical protein VN24_00125 [Paenibacillus beijingensis]